MSIENARLKLPLKVLMAQYGHTPKNERWKDMECPFCKKKDGAGVFRGTKGDLFKCHHTSCPSGPKSLDEVGYVGAVSGISRKEAFKEYLKMAGEWKEGGYSPSIPPGQPIGKKADPVEKEPLPEDTSVGAGVTKGDNAASGDASPCYAGGDLEGAAFNSSESGSDPEDSGDSFAEREGSDQDPEASGQEESGGPPGNDEPDDDEDGGDSWQKACRVLDGFYASTSLTPQDADELLARRGLTLETCQALGFRTNDQTNKVALRRLSESTPEDLLVKVGLWVQNGEEAEKPNAQFFGWGVTGKTTGSDDIEWGWKEDGKCNPTLIPYWDESGKLIHLRPHKGMTKDGLPRLWVARNPAQISDPVREVAVICEGEFKGAAIWQVLGDRVAVASLPGITMSKHWLVSRELMDWLAVTKPKIIVVTFDNEEKGDPALPGFKPDRRKRYDAEIWARYLAQKLRHDGLTTKVARLPDEWRDAKGKADWDGVLARRLAECRELTEDLRCESKLRIRNDFWKVISTARPVSEIKKAGLYETEVEKIIRSGLAKLFYTRALPVGGDRECGIATKLQKSIADVDVPAEVKAFLSKLATDYRETVGKFYNIRPLRDVNQERWLVRSNLARSKHDHKMEWICAIVLKGIPHTVADFRLEGHFVVVREDGNRDRMVKLYNVHGQSSGLVAWDARSMSRPTEFRQWLFTCGNFLWGGNERDLQALQKDLNSDVMSDDVHQVVAYGWHEESRLWFFRDCALGRGSDGRSLVIKPDEWGIYWTDGRGYLMGERGKDEQTFRQGSPLMKPELGLMDLGVRIESFQFGLDLVPHPQTEEELFRAFLRETCERLRLAVGGYEAYVSIGLILAYGAAPELFKKFGQFPGLWPNGQTASGKTTLASWLMEFWGFHNRDSGLGLKSNVTAVGLQIALEQYSNLPVWADEYENDAAIQESLKGIIHSSFNREIPSKWTHNGEMRQIRTNLIVSGETTPGRAATRSRFALVQMAVEKRPGTRTEQMAHWSWLQEHRSFFFVFGREILRRRDEFAAALLGYLKSWREAEDVKAIEERTKFVYGVGYASFMAMLSLWETHGAKDCERYRQFLKENCLQAVDNVNVSINANRFWADLMSAHSQGEFGHNKSELSRFFKVQFVQMEYPPKAPTQGAWRTYKLFINFNGVMGVLRQFLRRQGQEFPLTVTDLRDQLSKKEYWVAAKTSEGHRQRFGTESGGSAVTRCWCVDLDRHELGYRWVPDDALSAERLGPDGIMIPTRECGDPRKGELFQLVEMLEREGGNGG